MTLPFDVFLLDEQYLVLFTTVHDEQYSLYCLHEQEKNLRRSQEKLGLGFLKKKRLELGFLLDIMSEF